MKLKDSSSDSHAALFPEAQKAYRLMVEAETSDENNSSIDKKATEPKSWEATSFLSSEPIPLLLRLAVSSHIEHVRKDGSYTNAWIKALFVELASFAGLELPKPKSSVMSEYAQRTLQSLLHVFFSRDISPGTPVLETCIVHYSGLGGKGPVSANQWRQVEWCTCLDPKIVVESHKSQQNHSRSPAFNAILDAIVHHAEAPYSLVEETYAGILMPLILRYMDFGDMTDFVRIWRDQIPRCHEAVSRVNEDRHSILWEDEDFLETAAHLLRERLTNPQHLSLLQDFTESLDSYSASMGDNEAAYATIVIAGCLIKGASCHTGEETHLKACSSLYKILERFLDEPGFPDKFKARSWQLLSRIAGKWPDIHLDDVSIWTTTLSLRRRAECLVNDALNFQVRKHWKPDQYEVAFCSWSYLVSLSRYNLPETQIMDHWTPDFLGPVIKALNMGMEELWSTMKLHEARPITYNLRSVGLMNQEEILVVFSAPVIASPRCLT